MYLIKYNSEFHSCLDHNYCLAAFGKLLTTVVQTLDQDLIGLAAAAKVYVTSHKSPDVKLQKIAFYLNM